MVGNVGTSVAALIQQVESLTVGPNDGSVTLPGNGGMQLLVVTDATAFTIQRGDEMQPFISQYREITVEIRNFSGGTMGAVTWAPDFVLTGGAWVNPANGKRRWIKFFWSGANFLQWIEIGRAPVDY